LEFAEPKRKAPASKPITIKINVEIFVRSFEQIKDQAKVWRG
jgi:hypothetical protein